MQLMSIMFFSAQFFFNFIVTKTLLFCHYFIKIFSIGFHILIIIINSIFLIFFKKICIVNLIINLWFIFSFHLIYEKILSSTLQDYSIVQ